MCLEHIYNDTQLENDIFIPIKGFIAEFNQKSVNGKINISGLHTLEDAPYLIRIIEKETGGWGTFYSSPEPHALFFAFSFIEGSVVRTPSTSV